jgi:hypothetical protein
MHAANSFHSFCALALLAVVDVVALALLPVKLATPAVDPPLLQAADPSTVRTASPAIAIGAEVICVLLAEAGPSCSVGEVLRHPG